MLDLSDVPWLDELSPDAQEEIQARLVAFATRNGLARAVVNELRGETLYVKLDTDSDFSPGEENLLTMVDQTWLQEAVARGEAVATASYQFEGVPHMRAHTPLRDATGRTVGVLTIEGLSIEEMPQTLVLRRSQTP